MLTRMIKSATLGKEHGATAPEYALLIALIASIIVAAIRILGNQLVPIFSNAAGWFGS